MGDFLSGLLSTGGQSNPFQSLAQGNGLLGGALNGATNGLLGPQQQAGDAAKGPYYNSPIARFMRMLRQPGDQPLPGSAPLGQGGIGAA